MKKKFDGSLNHLFSTVLRLFLVIFGTFLLAFVLVFPLWKWASVSERSYSIFVTIIIVLAFAFVLIQNFKKQGALVFFRKFSKIALIFLALLFAIFLVLNEKKFIALCLIPITIILYSLISRLFAKVGKK